MQEEQSQVDDEEVLLNVSPNKFEKPKDQLYMDFFVKYTEVFVDEAKKDSNQQKNKFSENFSNKQMQQATRKNPPGGRMRLVATSSRQ